MAYVGKGFDFSFNKNSLFDQGILSSFWYLQYLLPSFQYLWYYYKVDMDVMDSKNY